MKSQILFSLSFLISLNFPLFSKELEIKNVNYYGPMAINQPWKNGEVDINNKEFSPASILKGGLNLKQLAASEGDTVMILGGDKDELHYLSFPVTNSRFSDLSLQVDGVKNYKILLDDKEVGNELKLKPGTREIGIKILTKEGEKDTLKIKAFSSKPEYFTLEKSPKGRAFTLDDVIYADHFTNTGISPSGKYGIVGSVSTIKDKNSISQTKLINLETNKVISFLPRFYYWLPNEDKLWFTRNENSGKRNLISLNPFTMEEEIIAEGIPEGSFVISPDLKRLIYYNETEGPKEDKDIYQVWNPEDRQPGYRDRMSLWVYDLNTGLYSPLTFGNKNIMLQDISSDGKRLLLMDSRNRFEKRPTTVFSLYDLTLDELKVDTLVFEDGFISGAQYSPDGSQIVISGSPEALNGIGKNVPEGRIPSMTDGQLFLLDITSKEITPITKFFNPAVSDYTWHPFSGNIFFTAEDRDKKSLFRYDPKSKKIDNLDFPEDIITNFEFADNAMNGISTGESASNPDVLYAIGFNKNKPTYRKLESKGLKMLSEVALADVIDWDFINSKGDTINGRFYLPPDFDPEKKYPLIVNYYGGCSPTSKNFATRYPHHVYANNGYVVYVINPSGATGFGQEFSSRHVNTAGEGVAEDIIEGTKKFLEEHPYIDQEKIGCIGASYGGFMTQYLQTVTDLFAAAISHAGISDHTSYWGNGFWGYSYSEVSMADSYPWTNPDLYVKQSPLYNADKINTPILFLHGDEDTNVPPAESIQLFTALKLLGKDTALVEVTGQNHHILDYDKRQKWQDTIFAWFAKYLQDDPTWWNELYPSSPQK